MAHVCFLLAAVLRYRTAGGPRQALVVVLEFHPVATAGVTGGLFFFCCWIFLPLCSRKMTVETRAIVGRLDAQAHTREIKGCCGCCSRDGQQNLASLWESLLANVL